MTESGEPGQRPRVRRTDWLTVREVAQLLHVKEDTVRRWIRQESLAATFFGGRTGYRIRRADLRKFLNHSARPRVRRPIAEYGWRGAKSHGGRK